jgi:hypothetical protein
MMKMKLLRILQKKKRLKYKKLYKMSFLQNLLKTDLEKIEKSSVSVTTEDIISHSGRPAPKTITYEKPRYDKKSWWDYPRWQKVKWVITTSKGKYKETEDTQIEEQKVVKKPKIATTSANLVKKAEIVIDWNISVKEFSEKMGVPLNEVMRVLMQNQLMLWITANLDFDTASLIAEEFWVTVKKKKIHKWIWRVLLQEICSPYWIWTKKLLI